MGCPSVVVLIGSILSMASPKDELGPVPDTKVNPDTRSVPAADSTRLNRDSVFVSLFVIVTVPEARSQMAFAARMRVVHVQLPEGTNTVSPSLDASIAVCTSA